MARAGVRLERDFAARIGKTKSFQRTARAQLNKKVQQAKVMMMQEFNSHPVTTEIEGGVRATNISSTLGGIGSGANLFTYIGFDSGTNPTLAIKTYLNSSVRLGAIRTRASGRKRIDARVTLFYPTAAMIRKYSQLPWEPGKSWIEGMENGISGFGYYMFKKFQDSRSGFALQSRQKVRQGHFRPTPYLSKIIHNFLKRVGLTR